MQQPETKNRNHQRRNPEQLEITECSNQKPDAATQNNTEQQPRKQKQSNQKTKKPRTST